MKKFSKNFQKIFKKISKKFLKKFQKNNFQKKFQKILSYWFLISHLYKNPKYFIYFKSQLNCQNI